MLKNLVYFSIFTTFVVLVWISLTIYHVLNSSTITQAVNIQITPLNPTFNTNAISGLSAREQFLIDLSSSLATPSATTLTPSTSPITKPIGTFTGTPSAALTPGASGGVSPNL